MSVVIAISDNVECMRILTEVGILDKLYPEPPYDRAHAFFEYGGCWCVAAYGKGHADEKDNGYSIIGIPFSFMPKEKAHAFLVNLMHKTEAQPGGTLKYVKLGGDDQ